MSQSPRSVPLWLFGSIRARTKRQWKRLRRWAWKRRISAFRERHRSNPASLDQCLALQARASASTGVESPLLPDTGEIITDGGAVGDPELAWRLAGEEIGDWSLTADTIDWLADLLERAQPRRIVEFGSGVSTLCFCLLLARLHGPRSFRLLSLEQNAEYRDRTAARIEGEPGAGCCRVVHVPLVPSRVEGHDTRTYDFSVVEPQHFEWLGEIDFVFIDGPFAEGPCRYATLPWVRDRLAEGARFAMDDALRWKELHVADLWRREGVIMDGILTIGEGVLVGHAGKKGEGSAMTGRPGRDDA